jgi:hypothetical protein
MIDLSVIRDLVAIFGVIAGFSYYVLTVRTAQKNQQLTLENRQAQLFWNIYDKWTSDRVANASRITRNIDFKDYEEFEKFWDNPDPDNIEKNAMAALGGYYEGVGVFVREKLIDIRLVALLMRGMTTQYFAKQRPYVERYRIHSDFEGFLIETEYLYNELMRYIEENPDYRTQQHP